MTFVVNNKEKNYEEKVTVVQLISFNFGARTLHAYTDTGTEIPPRKIRANYAIFFMVLHVSFFHLFTVTRFLKLQ